MCIFLFQGAPGEPKVSRTVDMFSEDMFAENYSSPSSTAKMIANQVPVGRQHYKCKQTYFYTS